MHNKGSVFTIFQKNGNPIYNRQNNTEDPYSGIFHIWKITENSIKLKTKFCFDFCCRQIAIMDSTIIERDRPRKGSMIIENMCLSETTTFFLLLGYWNVTVFRTNSYRTTRACIAAESWFKSVWLPKTLTGLDETKI